MTERDRGMNWPIANKNSLSKYIGPAVVLALATSIFYLFGMTFQSAHFDRFSFPYQGLNLPPTIFIIPLIIVVILNAYIFMILYEINNYRFDTNSETRIRYKIVRTLNYILQPNLRKSWIIFFLLIIFINYGKRDLFNLFLLMKTPIILFYEILLFYLMKKFVSNNLNIRNINLTSISHFLLKTFGIKIWQVTYIQKQMFFVLISFIFIIGNMFLVVSIADFSASNLIEGKPGNYEAKLDLNNSSCNLPGDTFILVMQHEGFLYLVKKEVPAPLRSTLYVVPATKFNYATINLIAPENKQVSINEMFYNLTKPIWNLPNSIKPYLNNSSTRNNVS